MEYVFLAISIVIILVVVIVIKMILAQKKLHVPSSNEVVLLTAKDTSLEDEVFLVVEQFPVEEIRDKSMLAEIKDNKVLMHINNLIPELAQIGNTINNMVQSSQDSGEVLYRVILPAGAELANSHAMEGAKRGLHHGANGIKGHADLVAVEAQKGASTVANSVAAAMNVASMVVGQYYMSQINDELNEISEGIAKISDFQNNEYRSRVFSLLAHVKKIADFQVEILENDELRLSKITQLDNLEEECTKLLGQANLTLSDYTKEMNLDYKAYEAKLQETQMWYMYQGALLEVLVKIADLRYALHLGNVSQKQCIALLPTYKQQVEDTQKKLVEWHHNNAKRLNVNIEKTRRKRMGVDGFIHFIPGLINEDLGFRPIKQSTVDMITIQTADYENTYNQNTSDLYEKDVQLILKDNKIYYWLEDYVD